MVTQPHHRDTAAKAWNRSTRQREQSPLHQFKVFCMGKPHWPEREVSGRFRAGDRRSCQGLGSHRAHRLGRRQISLIDQKRHALIVDSQVKAWGQNDDITVVTIQRIASSEVRRKA